MVNGQDNSPLAAASKGLTDGFGLLGSQMNLMAQTLLNAQAQTVQSMSRAIQQGQANFVSGLNTALQAFHQGGRKIMGTSPLGPPNSGQGGQFGSSGKNPMGAAPKWMPSTPTEGTSVEHYKSLDFPAVLNNNFPTSQMQTPNEQQGTQTNRPKAGPMY